MAADQRCQWYGRSPTPRDLSLQITLCPHSRHLHEKLMVPHACSLHGWSVHLDLDLFYTMFSLRGIRVKDEVVKFSRC